MKTKDMETIIRQILWRLGLMRAFHWTRLKVKIREKLIERNLSCGSEPEQEFKFDDTKNNNKKYNYIFIQI